MWLEPHTQIFQIIRQLHGRCGRTSTFVSIAFTKVYFVVVSNGARAKSLSIDKKRTTTLLYLTMGFL
jgi:hypothetical protein